jgi:hypothetical protein
MGRFAHIDGGSTAYLTRVKEGDMIQPEVDDIHSTKQGPILRNMPQTMDVLHYYRLL